jgi:hypothetical protein
MCTTPDRGPSAPDPAAPALKDEAPGGTSAEGFQGQARTNGLDSDGARGGRQSTQAENRDKEFATLAARCALAGHQLTRERLEHDGYRYVVARWGLRREFADLTAVERWVDVVEGKREATPA